MHSLTKRILVRLAVAAILAWGASAYANTIPAPSSPTSGSGTVGGTSDPTYSFTFSDGLGDVGFGTLNATDSGLGNGSLLVTSGTLTVTSNSLNSPALDGTFSLIAGGPNTTDASMLFPCTVGGTSNDCIFAYDDLIYPANSSTSYLTTGGLLFGTATGPQINIWGNGSPSNYEFGYAIPGSYLINDTGGTFTLTLVPEPSTMALLGLALVILTLAIVWVKPERCRLAA